MVMGIPDPVRSIQFVKYSGEEQLPYIQGLIDRDLSEPYSVFTYRYFLNQWPHLSFLAMDGDVCVGCIVCKLEDTVKGTRRNVRRGYIAMLAVENECRKKGTVSTRKEPCDPGLGTELACRAIRQMLQNGCEEVVLEAEESNKGALRLYENLGFIRAKRLEKYYLNGSDAFRLKLTL